MFRWIIWSEELWERALASVLLRKEFWVYIWLNFDFWRCSSNVLFPRCPLAPLGRVLFLPQPFLHATIIMLITLCCNLILMSQASLLLWTPQKHVLIIPSFHTLACMLHPRFLHLRRQWQPTPVFLPGKSHGWRSLVGCSPWGREESDTTERLHFHFSLSCIGEGNGKPLQCSCLENPRDGGGWWAAIYGVAQSWTQLKWLSSW